MKPEQHAGLRHRVVFVTREPMVHQVGGSTACALNLLEVLARQGAEIRVLATLAYSRSPRLWFRRRVPLPGGVAFEVPGYWRLGSLYVRPFAPLAWARAAVRLAALKPPLRSLGALARRLFGRRLFTRAWDLTPPTRRECDTALARIAQSKPACVIVNYAMWGPLFGEMDRADVSANRIVLMHDLLSARVSRFLAAAERLDCPLIEETQELTWLNCADCVLASQEREAEYIRPLLRARGRTQVMVQPIVLRPQRAQGRPQSQRCLFVGSNIPPNVGGLRFFLEEVWPRVRASSPAATLAIVGTVCVALPESFSLRGVELMGVVPSIESEYARAAVCVIPLIIGSGIKMKLIEALSFGRAAVSTSVGIQGMENWAAGVVDVADDPEAFAQAVLRLLSDHNLRRQREAAALRLIDEHYGLDRALDPGFAEAMFGARQQPSPLL